jgi:hypothetical protein
VHLVAAALAIAAGVFATIALGKRERIKDVWSPD